MSDLIGRQALIERLFGNASEKELEGLFCEASSVLRIINKQPPADQWIPCSERLPEKAGNYIVTSKGCTWVAIWFYYTWWGIEKRCRWTDVEAWMPLPEPYRGDTNG